MYIDYEKIGNILGFGQKFFYNMKVVQNCAYIKRNIPLVKQRLKNKKKLKVLFMFMILLVGNLNPSTT